MDAVSLEKRLERIFAKKILIGKVHLNTELQPRYYTQFHFQFRKTANNKN